MNRHERNIADVEFIFADLERFALMDVQSLMAHWRQHPQDALCELENPFRPGKIFLSREAYQRFADLAERYLKSEHAADARVSVDALADSLRSEFTRRFIKEAQAISKSSVARMLNSAYKAVGRSFQSRTYFLPCTITSQNEPSEFSIGPVRFLRRERFSELYGERLRQETSRTTEELIERWSSAPRTSNRSVAEMKRDAESWATYLAQRLQEFFATCDWVACVTIAPADDTASKEAAQRTVQAGLDLLKLLVGSQHSVDLRRGEAAVSPGEVAQLFSDPGGRFHITVGRGYRGIVAPQGWVSQIAARGKIYIEAGAKLLDQLSAAMAPTGLSARFLDALHWFGDATVEASPASALTKFVFALERVAVLDRDDKVADAVSNLSALFWSGQGEPIWEWTKRARAVYDARSDLAHGAKSPFDREIASVSAEAGRIASMTLLGILQIISRHSGAVLSDARVRQIYLDLEAHHYLIGWPWNR